MPSGISACIHLRLGLLYSERFDLLATIVAFDSPESSFFLFNSEARNEIKIFGFLRPRIVGSQRFFVSFV